MNSIVAYLNGAWIPCSELSVDVNDVGFLLGATVTERLRTFRGQVFRPDEHLQRLRRSLDIVGLNAEAISVQVASAIPEFIARNHALIEPDDDWAVAVFVTPGIAGAGRPTVCVHGFPLPFPEWAEKYLAGLTVVISKIRQVPDECWPSELKCRSRMHYYLADRAAAARRPGARAVLLDEDGFVAEATTANVLVHISGQGLVSPPSQHILAGVSLGVVKELAEQLSIPFAMRSLTVDELRRADEAMLASTSVCLLPIVDCDGNAIGDGKPGPVYGQLLSAWSEIVGVDVAEQARRCAPRRGT
jgi:branched-chain amino acid aminotransferase